MSIQHVRDYDEMCHVTSLCVTIAFLLAIATEGCVTRICHERLHVNDVQSTSDTASYDGGVANTSLKGS